MLQIRHGPLTGDAVDHGVGSRETRGDPVVVGLAQHDSGDRRPLAVDPADGPEGEAAAGREHLSTSRLRVFVAEDNGRFVGFAITMEVPGSLRLAHYWQIRDLFVLPTHRRLGAGRALLASVRAAAIASGALRLVVQTENDNDPALRLYADSGYSLIKGYRSLVLPLGPELR